ncbi:MAG TPA: GNAT family N-acetyltransferase [Phycisphaerae bacterium]|nr:GNAT family N-acetyltransferase [Phycisphaerae bacterium]
MEVSGRYRLVRGVEDAALVRRGLFVLVGGPEVRPGVPMRGSVADHEMKVEGFLAYAQSVGVDYTRQVVALGKNLAGEEVIEGMCLWVPSPGRTAMLFGPSLSEFPEAAKGTEAAIAGALEDARRAGIVLVQSMMEPADAAGKTVFAAAGLTQLATLTYMERRPPMHAPEFQLPGDLRMEPYSAGTHALFARAILGSYEKTLDCPALSGVREIEDIIAGHKAVGGPSGFDPHLWGVLIEGEKPVGCLLLGEIAARRALELVYLGLLPEVRGRGLGRVLMQRVLSIASRRRFDVATLAVDAANGPAVALYRRCGYTSVAQRIAMIRRLA